MVYRILELSKSARTMRRLQAKRLGLEQLGLTEAAEKTRGEIDRIDQERELLLGLCDALAEAHRVDPHAVSKTLVGVDPSGALAGLLAGRGT